jgi:hypothetical protein
MRRAASSTFVAVVSEPTKESAGSRSVRAKSRHHSWRCRQM